MKIVVTGGSGFIGTNYIDSIISEKYQIFNIDKVCPKKNEHDEFWVELDILNEKELISFFGKVKPDIVVHFAAETNCDPKLLLTDYISNTEGTKNLVKAVESCDSVSRFIFTSTQYVHQKKGTLPKNDTDYYPTTLYGESKIIGEGLVRNLTKNIHWTIIRPTNVWGPWHLRYPSEFWKTLQEGKYFHPGKKPVMRAYGYVKNVSFQINSIIESPKEGVSGKVYYVGDRLINLYDWVNEFSIGLRGKNVFILPRSFVYLIAIFGEMLARINIKFPLTLSRFNNMINDEVEVVDKTIDVFGQPPYDISNAIKETVSWLKEQNPKFWGV